MICTVCSQAFPNKTIVLPPHRDEFTAGRICPGSNQSPVPFVKEEVVEQQGTLTMPDVGAPPMFVAPEVTPLAEPPCSVGVSPKKRGRKPASQRPLPIDDISPQPDPIPPPPRPPTETRRVKNTELIVMNDCWTLIEGMPPEVQRRIVNWLDSQVSFNEQDANATQPPPQ